MLIQIFFFIL